MKSFLRAIGFILLCIVAGAQTYASDKVYFYYTDPAGTPLAMTNENGAIVWRAEYKPFGEIQEIYAPFNVANERMLIGKEMDVESGLYYFGARYMEAMIGRFMSADPACPINTMTNKVNRNVLINPQALNVYTYAINNPHRYRDLDGRWPKRVHDRLIDEAFSSGRNKLDSVLIGYLKDASQYVDREENQGTDQAFQHAMSRPGQTPEDAERAMKKFIGEKVQAYKMHMSRGETKYAFGELGQAFHAIMDSTSPPHEGFQVWGQEGEIENMGFLKHFLTENLGVLERQAQTAIGGMRDLFDSANK